MPWIRYCGVLSLFINVFLLTTPIYMLQIYDRVLVSGSIYTLWMLTFIALALILAYGLLDMLRSRLLSRAGYMLEQDLGPKVMTRIHEFELGGHPARNSERMRDVVTLRNYLSSPHLIFLFDTPWAPVFTLLIFSFSWILGMVTVVGIVILVVLALMDEKFTFSLVSQANAKTTEAWQFASSSVRNAEIVHALGMKPTMVNQWRALAEKALGHLKFASDRSSSLVSTTKVVRTLIQIAMLGVGAYLVIVDNLSPGIMIAGTIIVARAIAPVEGVISGWKNLIEARNAYGRVQKLLGGDQTLLMETKLSLPAIQGRVELDGVFFGFGPGNMLLTDVSLRLEPGEALGLVGPSGSGKSTLARIILGLVQPTQGQVKLDGYDIRQYERSELGKQLGYLPQSVELFEGSIARNIARMEDPASVSDEVVRVGEWTGVKAMVARFKEGYQLELGDNGRNLSGGQRQLVGLARALFGSPHVILLDEPDSHLDQEGQTLLINLIAEIREKRLATLIVVTHNPKIIDQMDRLLLLKEGGAQQLARSQNSQAQNPSPAGDRQKTPSFA